MTNEPHSSQAEVELFQREVGPYVHTTLWPAAWEGWRIGRRQGGPMRERDTYTLELLLAAEHITAEQLERARGIADSIARANRGQP